MRYWNTFLEELGIELITPNLPAEDAFALGRQSLPDVPAQVQLVLGRILELGAVDLVVLPQSKAVSQDAWSSDLAELLPRRISGLPTLRAVPDGGSAMPDAALELGQQLIHNAGQVRLALSRVKLLAAPPRESMPPMSMASQQTVAVIGPDSLLRDPFFSAALRSQLAALQLHGVFSSDLPRQQVEERGQQLTNAHGKALSGGERDLYGARQLLEGKGAVRGMVYVAAIRDAATHNTLSRLIETTRKPAVLLSLDPDAPELLQLAEFAAQLPLPDHQITPTAYTAPESL